MNEFTKDELVILKRLALQHVNQFRENSDCIDLMTKLKSLIDNYCENETCSHDYKIVPNAESWLNGGALAPITCIKCGQIQSPIIPAQGYRR